MKPLAEYLETRNALILALRDHDELLRKKRRKPGKDREIMAQSLRDMGVEPWEFGETPWVK